MDYELGQLLDRLRAMQGRPHTGLPTLTAGDVRAAARRLGYFTPAPDLPGPICQVVGAGSSRPVGGWDSTLGPLTDDMPDTWTADEDDRLALLVGEYSVLAAHRLGQPLHHADWVITTDPDLVRRVARHPDHPGCLACEAGATFGTAYLTVTGRPLLLGVVYWARP